MAEHDSDCQGLGADESGLSLWRRSHLDRERGRPEANGASYRFLSEHGVESQKVAQGENLRIYQVVGGAAIRVAVRAGNRRNPCEIHEVQRQAQTGIDRTRHLLSRGL